MNFDKGSIAKALGFTIVNLAFGALLIFVILNWSNQSFSFWFCWAAIVLVGLFFAAAWWGAGDKSSNVAGFIVFIVLFAVGFAALAWALTSGFFAGWSWADFLLGIVCLVIIVVGVFVNLVYKQVIK